MEFSYFGKNYFGYQVQPKQITVQEEIEKSLSTLLRETIKITGAGRTDTGVHAKKMYAHFDTEQLVSQEITKRMNAFLPPDISIHRIFSVIDDFHARFDASYRAYEYHISLDKNPFLTDFSWQHWKKTLDIDAMNKAAEILFEYDDFACFSKIGGDNKTTICEIFSAQWAMSEGQLIFTISANRFLRNMVRAIVGTLVEVGRGKLSLDDFRDIIESKDRSKAGSSAPAQGLYLVDVGYDWQKYIRE